MSLENDVASAPAPAPEAAPPASSPPSAPAIEKAPDTTPEAAEAALDDDLRKVWRDQSRERDDSGKFVAKDGKKAEPPAPAVDEPAKEAKDAKPTTPETAAKPAEGQTGNEAPRAWPAEMKAKWATLPPDIQQVVAARETELHEVKSDIGRLAATYRPMNDVLKNHKSYLEPALEATRQSLPQFLDRVITASAMLDSNPVEGLRELAKNYGVDLSTLYDPLAQPPDPKIAALERKVQELSGRLQQEDQQRAASAEQQEAARVESMAAIVTEFMTANPDAKGIENDILAQISAIQRAEPNLDPKATLSKAYERAAWANEKTRNARLKAEIEASTKASEAAAKAASRTAHNAASVNVRGAPSPVDSDDLDADLRSIWRKSATR